MKILRLVLGYKSVVHEERGNLVEFATVLKSLT